MCARNKYGPSSAIYLSHLIFADDLVLIPKSTSELQKMVQDIHETSKPVGLHLQLGKTKVMCNPVINKTDLNINGRKIKEVESYIYFSQMVTKDHDKEQELRHKIGLGWTAFSKLDSIKTKHTTDTENKSAQWMHTPSNHVWKWNMVPQQNTAAENGHNTTQDRMNNDRTNAAWWKKCKLDLLKDRCHWCCTPNLHQQAPMGRACLTAERQQVDQTCDRVLSQVT